MRESKTPMRVREFSDLLAKQREHHSSHSCLRYLLFFRMAAFSWIDHAGSSAVYVCPVPNSLITLACGFARRQAALRYSKIIPLTALRCCT